MGKSRSVTVILAYLLLTRPATLPTVQSALDLVRESRPMAEPNDGFMAQLELYKSMGCPTNIDAQPVYQRWLYQQEVDLNLAVGRAPDRLRFEDEEQQEEGTNSGATGAKELRCKKCRRTLATPQYLIPHVPKPSATKAAVESDTGPIASLPLPNPSAATLASSACTHHFLQPLSWMRSELEKGELSGRLECPNAKCGASVGRYAWQGMKCSCSEWVVPGFSLAAGKVDEAILRKGPGAGVRMPPGVGKGNL
jgi:dual specificity phosphatase 12